MIIAFVCSLNCLHSCQRCMEPLQSRVVICLLCVMTHRERSQGRQREVSAGSLRTCYFWTCTTTSSQDGPQYSRFEVWPFHVRAGKMFFRIQLPYLTDNRADIHKWWKEFPSTKPADESWPGFLQFISALLTLHSIYQLLFSITCIFFWVTDNKLFHWTETILF